MLLHLALVFAAFQPSVSPAAPAGVTIPGPAASLGLRWTADAAGRYLNRMQQTVVYTGGYSATISQTQELEFDRAVEPQLTPLPAAASDDKGAPAAATLTRVIDTLRRVAVSIKSGDTAVAYDSEKPTAEPGEFDVLRALVGMQTQFSVTPEGTIAEVKGLSDVVDKARARAGESPAAASILDQYKASMSDAAMKRTLDELLAIAPGREVRLGDTWSRTTSVSMGAAGTLSVVSTHKLSASEAGKATIATESVLGLQAAAASAAAGPAASFTLRDGSGRGETVIDTQRGVLLSRSYTLRLTLDSKAGNQSSSQSIENKTEMLRR